MRYASNKTKSRPAPTGTSKGLNSSVTGTSRAEAARRVGPPQGRIFMVPAPRATIVARVVRRMPTASYRGSKAGTVIRKVTAPEPSRCTIMASTAVARAIRAGSRPARCSRRPIIGRKVPASVSMPKNRMAKMNITPVGAIAFMPSVMKVNTSVPKPPASAAATGTAIRATTAETFRVMIRISSSAMVRMPNRASIKKEALRT